MSSVTDEIIERKLMIDGDGTGDDRRITLLYKTFIEFCENTNPKESKEMEEQILQQLDLCEHMFRKSLLQNQMHETEKKNYLELSEKTRDKIDKSVLEVEELKKRLADTKRKIQNEQECQILKEEIENYLPRDLLEIETNNTKLEIKILKKEKRKLEMEEERRKRLFLESMKAMKSLEHSEMDIRDEFDSDSE